MATSMPEGVEMLLKKCRKAIKEWCDQVLVLGLNRGRYDLNLIKEYVVETLADTTDKVQVGKKGEYDIVHERRTAFVSWT